MLNIKKLTDDELWLLTCGMERFHDSIRHEKDEYAEGVVDKVGELRETLDKEFNVRKLDYKRWIAPKPLDHVWKRYDTGIGYGGYKECVVCGLTTYSERCSKCNKVTPLTDVCAGKKHCRCIHVPYKKDS